MSAVVPGTGSTSFEEMSHERMLAWLDQANPGTVRFAADRLTAAAEEIRRIGEELKVRPQYVDWQGEGADVFRTWAGDLANSTLRLGDFSADAAKWLGQASDAIAHAQAAIPRDTKSARANLNAAPLAHNAPDAAAGTAVNAKSAGELAALVAAKEKIRQEAALQMLKLGQSYRLSATQLDGLERPTFPPPPKAVQPPDARGRGSQSGTARPGGGDSRTFVRSDSAPRSKIQIQTHTEARMKEPAVHSGVGEIREPRPVDPPVRMGVDSLGTVGTLPQVPITGAGTSDGPSGMGQAHSAETTTDGGMAPVFGGRTSTPDQRVPGRAVSGSARSRPEGAVARSTASARPTVTGRPPSTPGQAAPVPSPGRAGGGSANGVVGGRPTSVPAGRPTGGIPRGTVVGAESPTARGPAGNTAGSGRAVSPYRGVVGGAPQQPVRVPSSPRGAGGAGGSVASGAAVRDGVSGGTSNAGRSRAVRAGAAVPRSTPSASSTRVGGSGSRSDRAAEDRQLREKHGSTGHPRTD
jgi:hypothetical protein